MVTAAILGVAPAHRDIDSLKYFQKGLIEDRLETPCWKIS
jgi:hypothetical protein